VAVMDWVINILPFARVKRFDMKVNNQGIYNSTIYGVVKDILTNKPGL